MRMDWNRTTWALLTASLGLLASCQETADRVEIQETKTASSSPVNPAADSAARFGTMGAAHGQQQTTPASEPPELRYDLPASWEEVAPTSMRMLNLKIGDAECYLTLLPGDGGGLAANVNRWFQQVGQPGLSEAEVANLPKIKLLDQDATLVDAHGRFTGMGDADIADAQLLGAIVSSVRGTLFLKMVGPRATVEPERDRFIAFAESLRFDTGAVMHSTKAPQDIDTSSMNPGELEWSAPDGWQRGKERSMRLVTYHPGGDESTECYVTLLAGTGGGVDANLNRWAQQMGQAALSEAEIAALPEAMVLGQACKIIEVAGSYSGMSGESVGDATLMGTVCLTSAGALFIKMVGPTPQVQAARDEFVQFCESFQQPE